MALLMGVLTAVASSAQLFGGQENFVILGGELSNSAATSVDDIDEVLPRMKTLGLNTVLVPIYWELTEPTEGQMDFTLTDRMMDVAREQGLKVVPLWFGAWKNSMSCYAPAWFKARGGHYDADRERDWHARVGTRPLAAGREGL